MIHSIDLAAAAVATLISAALGTFWYSSRVFGTIWGVSVYGSVKKCENQIARQKGTPNQNLLIILPLVCPFVINLILLGLIRQFYSSSFTFNDANLIAIAVTTIHALTELPHLPFESRPYTAFIVHVVFHFFNTALPLAFFKFYLPWAKANFA